MLSLSALVFVWALIDSGADPRTTIALTLILLAGIVAVVATAAGAAARRHRLLDAIRVLLGDGKQR